MTTALVFTTGASTGGADWLAPANDTDRRVLSRAVGPVLDIGCGPGRHVRALVEAGVVSLGIDITPAAVRRARRVGAPVLHRSVFDGVPGAGRYATALLLDGNIGIGGRPELLLRRTAELLRPGGRILIETTERGGRTVATDNAKHARSPGRAAWFDEPRPSSPETAARFVVDHEPGPWFEWRDIAAAEVRRVAAELGFTLRAQWDDRHRHFVRFDTRIDRR